MSGRPGGAVRQADEDDEMTETDRAKFKHFISLGSFCSVALDLEALGLREASMPFDWNIDLRFEGVIGCIENHFEHFLDEEELSQSEEAPEHYKNRYDIQFFHDFNMWEPLAAQLPAVQDKYERRIRHFYQITAEPTLFIRYMDDRILEEDGAVHELRYIEENYDHIMDVLKALCLENELILIANSEVKSDRLSLYSVGKDMGDIVARVPREKNRELGELLDSFSVPDQEANRLRGAAAAKRRRQIERQHKLEKIMVKTGIKKPYRHDKTYR